MNRVLLTEDRNAHESDSWVKSLGLKKDDRSLLRQRMFAGGTHILGNVFRGEHIYSEMCSGGNTFPVTPEPIRSESKSWIRTTKMVHTTLNSPSPHYFAKAQIRKRSSNGFFSGPQLFVAYHCAAIVD